MSSLAIRPEARLARPLKVLIPLIKEDLEKAQEAGLEHYRSAGEKLQEAKSQIARGHWGEWLAKNFRLSQQTADAWMRLAGELEFREAFENSGDTNLKPALNSQRPAIRRLSDVTSPGRDSHQPRWHAPVQQVVSRVDVSKMREHIQDREKEKKLQRKLGLELIDIGYKVLATKLHPDHGGSPEAMARLNEVRDVLKGAL